MPDIDMRVELANWLREHGHYGVHRSAILGQRCSCVGPLRDDPLPDCRKCLATGQAYVDYIVKLDRRGVTPASTADTGAGEPDQFQRVKDYVERIGPVKRDDFLLELELDPTTLEPVQPYRISRAYRIVEPIEDLRDKEGRLEFVQVSVELVSVR